MDRQAIYEFVRRQQYGVVASIAADGTPQSALVGIAVTAELDIVFDTLKTSRKYVNLVRDPRCSCVIGWAGEQTLQLEGVAHEPVGEALFRLQQVYYAAWPEGISRRNSPEIAYMVVRPTWLRFSDYAQTTPLIWETTLGPAI